MAGSKSSLTGEDFYGMYDAQEFAIKHAPELGMQAVPSLDVVYTEEAGYVTAGGVRLPLCYTVCAVDFTYVCLACLRFDQTRWPEDNPRQPPPPPMHYSS
jgi:hypothetical protein